MRNKTIWTMMNMYWSKVEYAIMSNVSSLLRKEIVSVIIHVSITFTLCTLNFQVNLFLHNVSKTKKHKSVETLTILLNTSHFVILKTYNSALHKMGLSYYTKKNVSHQWC